MGLSATTLPRDTPSVYLHKLGRATGAAGWARTTASQSICVVASQRGPRVANEFNQKRNPTNALAVVCCCAEERDLAGIGRRQHKGRVAHDATSTAYLRCSALFARSSMLSADFLSRIAARSLLSTGAMTSQSRILHAIEG